MEQTEDDYRELAREAHRTRRCTTQDAPSRRASEELALAMHLEISENGRSISDVARLFNMTRQGVRARLARYGFRQPAPSQAHKFVKDLGGEIVQHATSSSPAREATSAPAE